MIAIDPIKELDTLETTWQRVDVMSDPRRSDKSFADLKQPSALKLVSSFAASPHLPNAISLCDAPLVAPGPRIADVAPRVPRPAVYASADGTGDDVRLYLRQIGQVPLLRTGDEQ